MILSLCIASREILDEDEEEESEDEDEEEDV